MVVLFATEIMDLWWRERGGREGGRYIKREGEREVYKEGEREEREGENEES